MAQQVFLRPMRSARPRAHRCKGLSVFLSKSELAVSLSAHRAWALPCLVMRPRRIVLPDC